MVIRRLKSTAHVRQYSFPFVFLLDGESFAFSRSRPLTKELLDTVNHEVAEIARKLEEVSGIRSLTMIDKFMIISRDSDTDWNMIENEFVRVLTEVYGSEIEIIQVD